VGAPAQSSTARAQAQHGLRHRQGTAQHRNRHRNKHGSGTGTAPQGRSGTGTGTGAGTGTEHGTGTAQAPTKHGHRHGRVVPAPWHEHEHYGRYQLTAAATLRPAAAANVSITRRHGFIWVGPSRAIGHPRQGRLGLGTVASAGPGAAVAVAFSTSPWCPVLDTSLLVSATEVSSQPQTVVYQINPERCGRRHPLTYADFAYNWQHNPGRPLR